MDCQIIEVSLMTMSVCVCVFQLCIIRHRESRTVNSNSGRFFRFLRWSGHRLMKHLSPGSVQAAVQWSSSCVCVCVCVRVCVRACMHICVIYVAINKYTCMCAQYMLLVCGHFVQSAHQRNKQINLKGKIFQYRRQK